MKLASKFIILLLLGVLILIAVDGYLAVQREIDMFDTDMRRDSEQLGKDLQMLIAEVWQSKGQQHTLNLISQANKPQDLMHIRWVWLDAAPEDPYGPVAGGTAIASLAEGQLLSLKHTGDDGAERLVTYAQLAVGGSRPAALELIEPVTHSREMVRLFVVRMTILTAITFMLGASLVLFLGAEMVGKPLKLLLDKTRRIGRGDLSGPVQLHRRDEFGELATAINSMCEQLVEAQDKVNEETAARIAALEQLRHADRLRTVGRLASGIAHELGTPLNVVGGRANMIASGKLSSDETKQSATIIKAESDRITAIIRQLLDFARRSSPKRSSVDVRQLVDQTVDLLAPLAEKRRVHITTETVAGSYLCHVDAGQMQQVLTNLIVNAVQAMPDGGTVHVGLRHDSVSPPKGTEAAEGQYLLVSVRDEGQGISDDDMQQLFEPFFTTKAVGEGTGLGLSIAYGIVQEHAGWIDVQSDVGRGSQFTVYLPLEIETCRDAS